MTNPFKIIKNILPRKKKNDRDGDGVPNNKDCQPNNTMRQDTVFNPQTGQQVPAAPPPFSVPFPQSAKKFRAKIYDKKKDPSYYKEYIEEKIY